MNVWSPLDSWIGGRIIIGDLIEYAASVLTSESGTSSQNLKS